MKVPPILIYGFYFMLIAAGSWYFGGYANTRFNSNDSAMYFNKMVLKAKNGMSEKECKAYDKIAGLSDNKIAP